MAKIRTRTTLFRDSEHRVPFRSAYRHAGCYFFVKIFIDANQEAGKHQFPINFNIINLFLLYLLN